MISAQVDTREKDDIRSAILQAAWGMMRHYGYAKTTIDDVAKCAGVGKGTVYLHFGSKAEIMSALAERTNGRITEELRRIATGPGSPEARLRACMVYRVLALSDIVHKHPHGEEFVSDASPETIKGIARHVHAVGMLIGGILQQGVESGELEVEDPHAAGQLFAELFGFLAPPKCRHKSRKSLETLANQTLDLLFSGLRSRSVTGMKRAAEG